MEITGKIINVFPLITGEGKSGPWKKQEYLIETNTGQQYAKKVIFNFWGDKVDQNRLQVGDEVKLFVDLESREYNGRWYTDVRAWKADKNAGNSHSHSNHASASSASDSPWEKAPESNINQNNNVVDDLPF